MYRFSCLSKSQHRNITCRTSSAGFLWELLHALQLFRFMMFLNVHGPGVLYLFSEFMEVANGDVEEIEKYTPKIFSQLLFSFDEQELKELTPPAFEKADIFSIPYDVVFVFFCVYFSIAIVPYGVIRISEPYFLLEFEGAILSVAILTLLVTPFFF